MRAKAYCAQLLRATLGPEVNEQMFQCGGQSDATDTPTSVLYQWKLCVNVIEEAVDLAKQINLEVDSDEVQELLNSRNQKLTMGEFIEMPEQDMKNLSL
ncbi:hypothetical protein TNCV_1523361 [Trichonephila clavipes]|nr:hypothetical protein TNCV_1523361 [Trichonephila clavipes]